MRFAELQRAISPDLSAKSLSESLGKLSDAGLIIRTEMPSAAREVIYELSPAGRETHDALKALETVAERMAGVQ